MDQLAASPCCKIIWYKTDIDIPIQSNSFFRTTNYAIKMQSCALKCPFEYAMLLHKFALTGFIAKFIHHWRYKKNSAQISYRLTIWGNLCPLVGVECSTNRKRVYKINNMNNCNEPINSIKIFTAHEETQHFEFTANKISIALLSVSNRIDERTQLVFGSSFEAWPGIMRELD